MNYLLNRLDNLDIQDNSYEFIATEIKEAINVDGRIVGYNGEYMRNEADIMLLIKNFGLNELIGINMYDALMRKPMMIFLIPTQEDEFEATKEELDNRYGLLQMHLNNFAQVFSIACWFIKDSCICATNLYWLNMFNGYNMQAIREMYVTLSDGTIAEVTLTDTEMAEAIHRMYEIYRYILPDEVKGGPVEKKISGGTVIWEIDKAIGTEGNSFARGLIKLQEARRAGEISSKIDKYCSVLECLYAINKEHKKNIANITAAYIGRDEQERNEIVAYMQEAYGIRSDSSHGDNLKYLKENDINGLKRLASIIDDYVRRVFRKAIANDELNYDSTSESKAKTRSYFRNLTQQVFPE